MTIQTVVVNLDVPKELKEAIDFLADTIEDVKEKKDLSTILTENIQGLGKAIEGADQMDDEAKSKHRNAAAAYCTKRIMDALLPQTE